MAFLPTTDIYGTTWSRAAHCPWPMTERHIHNNAFSTLFSDLNGSGFFLLTPTPLLFSIYFFIIISIYLRMSFWWGFSTEKIRKSRVNAWFLLYVCFFFFLSLSLSLFRWYCIVLYIYVYASFSSYPPLPPPLTPWWFLFFRDVMRWKFRCFL